MLIQLLSSHRGGILRIVCQNTVSTKNRLLDIEQNLFLKKGKINNENELFAFCNIIAKTFTPNENLVNDISEDENSSD